MSAVWGVIDTIFGSATARLDADGALTQLTFDVQPETFDAPRDDTALARVAEQISAYGRGERRLFDLPLAAAGGEFQLAVWAQLRRIPFGETRSYGDIAHALGKPGASRAVGQANNANPIPLITPCHRVIGADGSLTGFGSGLPLKAAMLAFECEQHTGQRSLF